MRLAGLLLGLAAPTVAAGAHVPPASAQAVSGQKDFDWEIGTWATSVRVRRNPLSGEAPEWVQYAGTSVIRSLLAGRANFVELSVRSPSGSIEGGSLRLYNPQARQWSLNFANLRNGLLTPPVYGGFEPSGRGLFYGQDMLGGRAILVRFIVTRPSADEAHFEQAYSADGGKSWEDNWIAVDRRIR